MNLKQQSFVTEMLRHGDKIMAYKIAYNSKSTNYRSLESAADRLLRNPEIRDSIETTRRRIKEDVEAELKQQMRRELLTVQRKREILAIIAEGDVYIEQTQKGKDCRMCKLLVKPGFGQMLKALDLDSKIAGHYVTKRQTTVVHTTATKQPSENQQEQPEPVAQESENEKTQQNATTERSELTETNKKDIINEVTEPSEPCNCDNIIPEEEIRQLFQSHSKHLHKVLIE